MFTTLQTVLLAKGLWVGKTNPYPDQMSSPVRKKWLVLSGLKGSNAVNYALR